MSTQNNDNQPFQQVVDPNDNIGKDLTSDEIAAKVKASNSENKDLQKQVDNAGNVDNRSEAEKLAEMSERLRQSENEKEDLKRQLNARNSETVVDAAGQAKTTGSSTPITFSHEKKKYRVSSGRIVVPGIGEVTAAEIKADAELRKNLVEMKSGFITEIRD